MKNKLLIITFLFILFSCGSGTVTTNNNHNNLSSSAQEDPVTEEIINHYTLNFLAAGDNLLHDTIIRASYINGHYDFSSLYSDIKDIVEMADIAFVNQETVMAGESYGYSGYPVFNSPQSLAHYLADAGFDIINLANNHAMDMRAPGLYATLDFLDTVEGLTVIGARREGDSARIITKNNISLGFLSYSLGLNGFVLPANNPNLVSLINRTKMEQEITALRPLCDFLIVSMHWGAEYLLQPGNDQVSLANFLAGLNVDLIIGHHPHVLQKAEYITLNDGRRTLCYYSLGNLISNQAEWERLYGGLAIVTFSKIESNINPTQLSISSYGMVPVVTHFDKSFRNHKTYPLYLYNEELLQSHNKKNPGDGFTMDFFYKVLERVHANIFLFNPFN